jgi:hypothetical protein
MPEIEETSLHSHEQGRQETMQSMQTADIDEPTKVSDKQSLSQHPEDNINITVSPNKNTSEERHYNIRS